MSEALTVVLAGAAGGLLGMVFFGGLWWTVRKGVSFKQPALWFSGSLLVRMGVVVSGVYVVSRGRREGLLSCLLGFVMANLFVMRLTRPSRKDQRAGQEASDAPYAR